MSMGFSHDSSTRLIRSNHGNLLDVKLHRLRGKSQVSYVKQSHTGTASDVPPLERGDNDI